MHGLSWVESVGPLVVVLSVLCVAAMGFFVCSAFAGRAFLRRRADGKPTESLPGISILKPIRGLDPDSLENFSSFCRQDYPGFEILFGAEDEADPGLDAARQVQRENARLPIRIIVNADATGVNPKIRVLARLAREARYRLLLVSDSDIRVGPRHLRKMVEPLDDLRVGVVTCVYRSSAEAFWGKMDALSLSSEFIPGVLLARQLEGMTFAMGAGTLIRRDVLERIGGFPALADSIADDYLLGNLPARAGYRVELADEVVDHRLGTRSLRDLLARQVRWDLTIRASRPWSYVGLLFTQGTAAALLLPAAAGGAAGAWALAAATLAVRLGAAWYVTVRCLDDRACARVLWLLPLCDALSTLAWLAGFITRTVVWRGKKFQVGPGGRLLGEPHSPFCLEAERPEEQVAEKSRAL